MTHRYINKGRNRSRLFARERVELLIELFWEVLEKKTFGNSGRVKVSTSDL